LKGIAHAVKLAQKLVSPNFILVLGDCYCRGEFEFPESMKQGIGVWETEDKTAIRQSYSIEISNNKVTRVIEKPKQLINRYCGMGFYFLNSVLFEYIDKTGPSAIRNEVEITNVIQNMIDGGENVSPVFFKGNYINITYENDLERIKLPFKKE